MDTDRPSTLAQLTLITQEILHLEAKLKALYIKRDQLDWRLDEGDHSE